MAIIVIGDVHASLHWQNIVAKRKNRDTVIFLGDYFDKRGVGPFAKDQAKNFRQICSYARNNPDTILLMGNHDYQYTPWDETGCSGKDEVNAQKYWRAISQNLDLLQIVHVREILGRNTIFSHGGVCKTFLDDWGMENPEEINSLWSDEPHVFTFRDYSSTGKMSHLTGDDPWQSPLWVRECSLEEDALPDYDQIVGHTPAPFIRTINHGEDVIRFVCTLDNNNFLILEN